MRSRLQKRGILSEKHRIFKEKHEIIGEKVRDYRRKNIKMRENKQKEMKKSTFSA